MGYDISNYEKVYPPYGSVKDMEDLVEACHKRYFSVSCIWSSVAICHVY